MTSLPKQQVKTVGVFSTSTKRLTPTFIKLLVLLFSYNMGALILILVLAEYTLPKSNLVSKIEYFTYVCRESHQWNEYLLREGSYLINKSRAEKIRLAARRTGFRTHARKQQKAEHTL